MDFWCVMYSSMCRKLISLSGYSPYQKTWHQRVLRSITQFTMVIFSVGMIIKLFTAKMDFISLFEFLPNVAVMTALAILSFTFDIQSNLYVNLWQQMEEDWGHSDMKDELEIRNKYATLGRRLMDLNFTSFNWVAVFYVAGVDLRSFCLDIISPLNESRPMSQLFEVDYLFIDNERYWILIMIYLHFCFYTFHTFSMGCQSIFLAYAFHLFGMFQILSYRLKTAVSRFMIDNSTSTKTNNPNKINCNAVIRCIKQHQRLLKFIDHFEGLYSPALLLGLFFSMLSLSSSLYITSNSSGSHYRAIIQTIVIMTFQLFLNILGQFITDLGVSLPNKVYCIDWYYLHPQAQKLLILILRQCLTPCKITAFKFFTISMDLYRAIIQTSVSYCMLFYYIKSA
ncbi:odorant receptor 4-like [Prorops nasuta]|uniref:odorant receptor 4-like n=1 Tax=Prorops nasuta TaxID=863751 RepID=UPI0034CF53E6